MTINNKINQIIIEAGKIALEFFNHNTKIHSSQIQIKSDGSKVTTADLAVDEFIKENLRKISNIPIISEEGENQEKTGCFWLIDPIDGTRAFIEGSHEFTINIALIENNIVREGFIYQPTEDDLFFTNDNKSFKQNGLNVQQIKTKDIYPPLFLHGRRNQTFEAHHLKMSSSLKFCKIAEGTAQIYYCRNKIMQWDIAAGQAIIEKAGGTIFNFQKKPLIYENGKSFTSESFIAAANSKLIDNFLDEK